MAIRPTFEVSSDTCHDVEGGSEAITRNQLLEAEILIPLPVLSPRTTIGLEELLTVVGEVILVEGKS